LGEEKVEELERSEGRTGKEKGRTGRKRLKE